MNGDDEWLRTPNKEYTNKYNEYLIYFGVGSFSGFNSQSGSTSSLAHVY